MNYHDLIRVRIALLLKQQNVSIRQLSRISGLSRLTIGRIIKGECKSPSASTLHKIANAFSMTPAEFWDTDDFNGFSFNVNKA